VQAVQIPGDHRTHVTGRDGGEHLLVGGPNLAGAGTGVVIDEFDREPTLFGA
jgi:hypothetical protein